MKILVYGINYYPELTGIGKYTGEMCEWLAVRKNQVDVITAMPYYPEWQVHTAYRGRGWHTEKIKGVNVKRCPLYVPAKVNGKSRMLHELSFFLSSLVFWIKAFFSRYDSVICIYPPLCIGLLPVLYKWVYGASLVFHIQDLQVDAARELGLIKNKKLIKLLDKVEHFYLRHADVVTTISEGMRKKVISKGVRDRKVRLFPNWVNTKSMQPDGQKAQLKPLYGYRPEEKVVLYAGNIGEKQGLDTLLEVAEALQHDKDLKFLIVGDGNAKDRLYTTAQDKQLDNVRFSPLVPAHELSQLLNMADLHLVLQKKGTTDLVMPSKLGSILSCGGVSLIASEKTSALRQLTEEYELGITAEAEDMLSIKNNIEQFFLVQHPGYALHARSYALQFLQQEHILYDFECLLKHLCYATVVAPSTHAKSNTLGSPSNI